MISRMVGGRSAGTVSNEPSALTPLNTRRDANSGTYLLTGSSSFHLPSSKRIIMATPVTGLVWE
jgi:hypothetical protein